MKHKIQIKDHYKKETLNWTNVIRYKTQNQDSREIIAKRSTSKQRPFQKNEPI